MGRPTEKKAKQQDNRNILQQAATLYVIGLFMQKEAHMIGLFMRGKVAGEDQLKRKQNRKTIGICLFRRRVYQSSISQVVSGSREWCVMGWCHVLYGGGVLF